MQSVISKENCSVKSGNGNGYNSNYFECFLYSYVLDMSNLENNAHIN